MLGTPVLLISAAEHGFLDRLEREGAPLFRWRGSDDENEWGAVHAQFLAGLHLTDALEPRRGPMQKANLRTICLKHKPELNDDVRLLTPAAFAVLLVSSMLDGCIGGNLENDFVYFDDVWYASTNATIVEVWEDGERVETNYPVLSFDFNESNAPSPFVAYSVRVRWSMKPWMPLKRPWSRWNSSTTVSIHWTSSQIIRTRLMNAVMIHATSTRSLSASKRGSNGENRPPMNPSR